MYVYLSENLSKTGTVSNFPLIQHYPVPILLQLVYDFCINVLRSIRNLSTPLPRQSCRWTGANEAIQERKTWREKWKDVLEKCHLIDVNIT